MNIVVKLDADEVRSAIIGYVKSLKVPGYYDNAKIVYEQKGDTMTAEVHSGSPPQTYDDR
jgi:hypothetical protein